jgi:hypothetical protein
MINLEMEDGDNHQISQTGLRIKIYGGVEVELHNS